MTAPIDIELQSIRVLAPRAKAFRFRLLDGKTFPFKAGQYVQVFPAGAPARNYFSIASPPSDAGGFELCVTSAEGALAAEFVHGLKVGQRLQALGPFGAFTLPDGPPPRDAAFLAAGSGVAPLRSMALDLIARGTERQLYLLLGARTEEDLLYGKDWAELAAKRPNFHYRATLSRPGPDWSGLKGYVQDRVTDAVPAPKEKDFYVCGPKAMVVGARETLAKLGVPEGQIHFERYG
jgi:ferredoxin-NADP reductase